MPAKAGVKMIGKQACMTGRTPLVLAAGSVTYQTKSSALETQVLLSHQPLQVSTGCSDRTHSAHTFQIIASKVCARQDKPVSSTHAWSSFGGNHCTEKHRLLPFSKRRKACTCTPTQARMTCSCQHTVTRASIQTAAQALGMTMSVCTLTAA